ncbi:hypothetical protein [Aequorivita antarctica]|uniref:Uncharacterized protein n=1 Tax=Aequorivita antarctica TaxID=153266 RepID=A0A5C6Z0I7_9FLAO|nr:hypothetical protein [Aequorivita antarctica]TXD73514.1 hypothetical protein ESU54_07055 [Aequorivita antarctica]SRX75692.1 hypothetical protein AEQU3_02688 [Aequorivita antarctica]
MKSKIHEFQNKYLAMSKISKIIFAIAIASTVFLTSCRDTKTEATDDHGHEHGADGSHMNEDTVEQEEFEVTTDSMQMKEDSHSHDNGSEHHDH